MRTPSAVVLAAVLLAWSASVVQPLHAQAARRHAGLLVGVGTARYPRPRDVEDGSVTGQHAVLSIGLEVPAGERWFLAPSIGGGFLPGACGGGCAPPSGIVSLAARRALGPTDAGLALGPSVERTWFDGARTGIGVSAVVGELRGTGARFQVRFHRLSGPGSRWSVTALFEPRIAITPTPRR